MFTLIRILGFAAWTAPPLPITHTRSSRTTCSENSATGLSSAMSAMQRKPTSPGTSSPTISRKSMRRNWWTSVRRVNTQLLTRVSLRRLRRRYGTSLKSAKPQSSARRWTGVRDPKSKQSQIFLNCIRDLTVAGTNVQYLAVNSKLPILVLKDFRKRDYYKDSSYRFGVCIDGSL